LLDAYAKSDLTVRSDRDRNAEPSTGYHFSGTLPASLGTIENVAVWFEHWGEKIESQEDAGTALIVWMPKNLGCNGCP